jgi:hypothetical protein
VGVRVINNGYNIIKYIYIQKDKKRAKGYIINVLHGLSIEGTTIIESNMNRLASNMGVL